MPLVPVLAFELELELEYYFLLGRMGHGLAAANIAEEGVDLGVVRRDHIGTNLVIILGARL